MEDNKLLQSPHRPKQLHSAQSIIKVRSFKLTMAAKSQIKEIELLDSRAVLRLGSRTRISESALPRTEPEIEREPRARRKSCNDMPRFKKQMPASHNGNAHLALFVNHQKWEGAVVRVGALHGVDCGNSGAKSIWMYFRNGIHVICHSHRGGKRGEAAGKDIYDIQSRLYSGSATRHEHFKLRHDKDRPYVLTCS